MKPLCIYHGNCADGFGAAWVVRRALGENVDFHPGVYQDPPPDVTDRDVILVDFSYKRPVLSRMAESARSVLVLDHHESAQSDLYPGEKFFAVLPGQGWADYRSDLEGPSLRESGEIWCLFDMERSGAGITWDFFFPGIGRPRLINHVEDRDLWKFDLPGTREIQANLFSYPYDFKLWDRLVSRAESQESWNLMIDEGAAIERKHHKDIAELVEVVTRPMKIGGHIVPAANLPYTFTSDAGHLLCERSLWGKPIEYLTQTPHPFATCYWDTPEGRVFSLRSREDGMDVSEIAKMYGGGGHKHAAGFRVPFSQLPEFEP